MKHGKAKRTKAFPAVSLLVFLLTVAGSGGQSNRMPSEQVQPRPSDQDSITNRVLFVIVTIYGGYWADEQAGYDCIPKDASRFLDEADFDQFDDPQSQDVFWSAQADAELAILPTQARLGQHDFVSDDGFTSASLDRLIFELISMAGHASVSNEGLDRLLRAVQLLRNAAEKVSNWPLDPLIPVIS